jgi:hypothetical protein
MSSHELLIGAFVSTASPLDELALILWPAHHTGFHTPDGLVRFRSCSPGS